jgi:hypothetical protein
MIWGGIITYCHNCRVFHPGQSCKQYQESQSAASHEPKESK